jgi:hypothetical protein
MHLMFATSSHFINLPFAKTIYLSEAQSHIMAPAPAPQIVTAFEPLNII